MCEGSICGAGWGDGGILKFIWMVLWVGLPSVGISSLPLETWDVVEMIIGVGPSVTWGWSGEWGVGVGGVPW